MIVECKQHAPVNDDIVQLRRYMNLFYEETGEMPRGILVHGGPQKISNQVISVAREYPAVEIVSYVLEVRFRPLV